MKERGRLFFLVLSLMAGAAISRAAETRPFLLEPVQVRAGREEREAGQFSKPVRVLLREDLDRIPGARLEDVLAREAGLVPRGGAGRSGGIDIRGMGDTFSSNVLVLLDDAPMNPRDLSGVAFSAISLEEVERIEIHRGAGGVEWGDGAVGGVVRIFTRKTGAPGGSLSGEMGSFGHEKQRLGFSGGGEFWGMRLKAGHEARTGFRENAAFSSRDAGVDFFSREKGVLSFGLSGDVYGDAYGLPGPVPAGGEEKKASTPFDRGETLEKKVAGRVEGDFGSRGRIRVQRILRYKSALMDMTGREQAAAADFSPVDIRSTEKTGRLDWDLPLMERDLLLHFGLDHQESHYVRTDPDANLGQRHNGRMEGLGAFLSSGLSLGNRWRLALGGRLQRVDGDYRLDRLEKEGWRQRELRERSWDMRAWDAGLSLDVRPGLRVYASLASSFRTPNVDEMARSDAGLRPQEGRHAELGLRSEIPGRLSFELGLFAMDISDEIHYDTSMQENRNYGDTTRRRGMETSLSLYPARDWALRMDLTWMQARFTEKDTVIPLVPELHGGLRIDWEPMEDLGLYLAGRWLGRRYDGNDTDNVEKALDPCQTWDLRMRMRRSPLDFFVEVNNLFDAPWVLAAYSGAEYPMPGRHFQAGVRFFF